MIFNCPGSGKFKGPQADVIECPFCAREVEVWSDEAGASCPGCKRMVSRNLAQCCLDWCKYAKECVGEERYKKYLGDKKGNSK